MGLKGAARKVRDAISPRGYRATEVTPEVRNGFHEALGEGAVLRVKPYKENAGIKGSEEFFQNVYEKIPRWWGWVNDSRVESFEIWFDEGDVTFQYYLPDREDDQRLKEYRSGIDAEYSDSVVSEVDGLFPAISTDDYIAGAEFNLNLSKYYPLRSPDGVYEFVFDPYRALTSSMTDNTKHRSVVQFVYKPALDAWTHGGTGGWVNPWASSVKSVSEHIKEGSFEQKAIEDEHHEPSREERRFAEYVAEQEDRPAYHLNVRVLTISPDGERAEQNARTIASKITNEYSEVKGQKLLARPLRGEENVRLAERMIRRDLVDRDIIVTIPELASLAHVPNETIENDYVSWIEGTQPGSVPSEAPRFNEEGPAGGGLKLGSKRDRERHETEAAESGGAETSAADAAERREANMMGKTGSGNAAGTRRASGGAETSETADRGGEMTNGGERAESSLTLLQRTQALLGLGYEGAGVQPAAYRIGERGGGATGPREREAGVDGGGETTASGGDVDARDASAHDGGTSAAAAAKAGESGSGSGRGGSGGGGSDSDVEAAGAVETEHGGETGDAVQTRDKTGASADASASEGGDAGSRPDASEGTAGDGGRGGETPPESADGIGGGDESARGGERATEGIDETARDDPDSGGDPDRNDGEEVGEASSPDEHGAGETDDVIDDDHPSPDELDEMFE